MTIETKRLPDGTGAAAFKALSESARAARYRAEASGDLTWLHLVRDRFWAAMAEPNPARLRAGLAALAADCLAWADNIDTRP